MTTEHGDVTAVAALVATGERSAVEVVTAALARIEAGNARLNAVIRLDAERALDRAQQVDAGIVTGPLAGVPILLKDFGGTIDGEPVYQGNQLLQRLDWRAKETMPIAQRLLDAGVVVLGRTNTPEFAAGPHTAPRSYGPTNNPWDLDRSTSGSSGGSAAAVAAGFVPFAHGNDFGGSIRMPAAWCGVIGCKPSRGRVSTAPAPPGAQTEFGLTTTLRDTALLLDVVQGQAPGEPPLPPSRHASWLDALDAPPGRLRIGLLTGVDGVVVDRRCARAAEEAAEALAAEGHDVVDLAPSFLADERWDAQQRVVRARGAKARLDVLAGLVDGRELGPDDTEPMILAYAAEAASIDDDTARRAGEWQLEYAAALERRWADSAVDAVVTPSTGIPPQTTVAMTSPEDDPLSILPRNRQVGCFAGPWNFVGFPALSLPWSMAEIDGTALPIGVQIVAGFAREDVVLQLANQLSPGAPSRAAAPPGARPTPRT